MAARELDTLIFFVTSRCNSLCRTCFYWEELNAKDDLSFEEFERLSSTMPRLQRDLALRRRADAPGRAGSDRRDVLPRRTASAPSTSRRTASCRRSSGIAWRESSLAVPRFGSTSTSLSTGLGRPTTASAASPETSTKALESLRLLEELRRRETRLRLHVNTVVCRENVAEMLPLGERMRDEFDLDGHYFQIIRGEPMDPALLEVHRDELEHLYRNLSPLYRHYGEKLRKRKGILRHGGVPRGVLSLYHEIQAANFDRHHRWPMPCTAGRNIAVSTRTATSAPASSASVLGSVRDYDCDWRRFWESRERALELEAIERDGCWCTHVCFIHASLKASPKAMLYDVPRAYLNSGGPLHGGSHAPHRA